MVKLLITNGCSLTEGEELASPNVEAWPSVLAGLLGLDLVNLGMRAGSNRRIVRTTVSSLGDLCRERFVRPEEALVLCLWTRPARIEHYDPHYPVAPRLPVDRRWRPLGPWNTGRRDKPIEAFYKHLWSEDGQLAAFMMDWILFDSFLRVNGFASRYAFGYRDIVEPLPDTVLGLIGLLDSTRAFGGFPAAAGRSFDEMAREFPRGPGSHPLAQGHAVFAAALADWLKADPRLAGSLPPRAEGSGRSAG